MAEMRREPEPVDLRLVRELFAAAMALPAEQREAYVRAQAKDAALRDQVLALLMAGALRTVDLVAAAQREVPGRPAGQPVPPSAAGDKVQSTATGELMQKLATAPKLDPQRFQLEGEIGKGGMGVVLRIHDHFLNRRLAMKVLLERAAPRDEEEKKLAHQLLGRFLEEAQVTSQLDHPGVVPVHELGLDQHGKVWFTMRLVKGRTADEVFADCYRNEGEWGLVRGLEVVLKVCDTMAYAHDKGVLHRDLKPGNVMVGRFGEVYVMDWGLAKVVGQADRHDLRIRKDESTGVSRIDSARRRDAEIDTASSVVSMDGQQLGTPSYMAPEQAKSEELDVRADVYSIGAMLYELVTGRAPYTAPGVRQPAYRILNDVVEGPPKRVEEVQKGVPAELVAIIDKAMARERGQRYANTLELAADVRAYLAQRAVQAYRTGALVELRLWVRRNRGLAASLAAAAVFLLAAVGIAVTFGASEAKAKEDALAQKQLANDKAEALDAKVRDFDQLSLVVDYERLLAEEQAFGPGDPDRLPAIESWLLRTQRLLGRREELSEVVARLKAAGGGTSGVATGTEFLAQNMGELVGKLPKLEALVPEVQKRQRWAKAIGPLTKVPPNGVSWEKVRAAIAANPKYAGQDIPLREQDVWGLVPIGENPQSKLWEFYDLRSAWDGESDPASLPIPVQQPDGRIEVTGATGIVFVLLPGGTLPAGTKDAYSEPSVRLQVRLDPFFLGKYEVTQGQWRRWTGKNPSSSKGQNNEALPVDCVSWYDCNAALTKVGLVLPSELQWEYGIRAGTTTCWWTGDDEKGIVAAENIGRYARGLLPVGSKTANPFGLFDMGGNLRECCFDEYTDYGTERAGDGRRPDRESGPGLRCFRGGIFGLIPFVAQSGNRYVGDAAFRSVDLGMRAARTSRL